VDEDERLTSLQLVEQRRKASIAQVDASGVAEQHHTVQAEHVQYIRQLVECAVHIGERQATEPAEPVGAVPDQLGRELVAPAGQGAGRTVVAGVHARCADRGHAHVDAGVVEEGQRRLAGPRRRRDTSDGVVGLVGCGPEEVGQHVVVDVDGESHDNLPVVAG
jgi:hypothetical protein